MERFAGILIGSVGVLMLIAPLWVLGFVNGPVTKLGRYYNFITTFIVTFFVTAALVMTASVFETLTATAAYYTSTGAVSIRKASHTSPFHCPSYFCSSTMPGIDP
jgi:hypothetical protein